MTGSDTQATAMSALDALRQMSGLDFLRGMMDGSVPRPTIADTLNFQAQAFETGSATFRGAPLASMANPVGGVHGGWYGTILDSAMACAITTTLPAGRSCTTLEFKVNIIRPIPIGTEVDAIGTVDHAGRSTGVASGVVRGVSDGKIYATASTTCLIMRLDG